MSHHLDASAVFLDGSVKQRDWIVLCSELSALADKDYELTRIFTYRGGEWKRFDVEGETIPSIYSVPPPGSGTFLLARDGLVIFLSPEGRKDEVLPDAGTDPGKLGRVTRIREIAGKLYVCGSGAQVYRREGNQWEHIDRGLTQPGLATPHFLSIDGTSESDIYVVGQHGAIFHFDGSNWTRFQAPTTEFLTWVRCLAPDEVYVCGRNGRLFRGALSRWQDLSVNNSGEHFWCVEGYNGKTYIAGANGLHVLENETVALLDTQLSPKPDAYRLYARDGVLWSIGNHHLCFLDGKTWTYVKHPDND